jgi:hypothetical protein
MVRDLVTRYWDDESAQGTQKMTALFQGVKPRSHRTLLCGVFIAMVQATESRMRNNAAPSRGANSATGVCFLNPRCVRSSRW